MKTDSYFIPLLLRHFRLMGVMYDPKQLELVLKSSPSYPSLLSILQVYTYYGLEATVYRADFEKLKAISLPLVVQVQIGGRRQFVLLYDISVERVNYYDAAISRSIIVNEEEFCAMWTGVLIKVEKGCNKIALKGPKEITKYTITSVIFMSLVLLVVLTSPTFETLLFLLGTLLFKSIGIGCSWGLLEQKSNGAYSVFNALCRRTAGVDCDKVSNSQGSKIFKRIDLTDVGFVYFATGIFLLFIGLFSGTTAEVTSILSYLTVCSIPFIFYSVVYQKFVVKKWCTLCLGVVMSLLIELIFLVLIADLLVSEIPFVVFTALVFACLFSLMILHYEKYRVEAAAKIFNSHISTLKLKRSPDIMRILFQRQKLLVNFESPCLTIGNRNAPLVITTLLNPICTPCKKLAADLVQILENFPTFVQWHLRFDGIETRDYHSLNSIQLHMFEFFRENTDVEIRLNMLKGWIRSQSLSRFQQRYPVKTISEGTKNEFWWHSKENKVLDVTKVPSVWINSREFPKEYEISDIPFFLTDIENLLKTTK